MKVLLLGGTGAMGSHLANLLVSAGVEVVVTSRNRSGVVGSIRYLQGNAHDWSFLAEVLRENWDCIVDFMVYNTPTFHSRVEHLLRSTAQYVFISSARVYADSKAPITEDSPRLLDVTTDKQFLATDEYALTKARQEDILHRSGRNNWTVIRPYITYSESRLQLGVLEKEGWLYRALNGRTIIFSSDIAQKKTTLTYGLDVARGISAIIGATAALGEDFHITSDSSLSWAEVLAIYMNTLEKHLARRQNVLLQDMKYFQKVHFAQYQTHYDRMFDRVFDNSKIKRFLDVGGFMPPETGLKRCLEAFLIAPQFSNISWRSEAAKDRQVGESSFKDIPDRKHRLKYLLLRYFLR